VLARIADGSAPPTVAPAAAPASRVRASPLARRLARELGVELARVTGSGTGGVITRADVERAASARPAPAAGAPPAEAPAAESAPAPAVAGPPPREPERAADRQAAMRQAIAAAMTRSNREIPHYYLATDIDLSRALVWLERENLGRPVAERLLPSALLLRAVALALRQVPELNGFWLDGAFRPSERVNLGVAISLRGGGLVAPAIHDADTLGIGALNAKLLDLVQRARTGRLRSSELTEATATVTQLGDLGAGSVFGLIYPPQVALVGFGKIAERPWAEGGMVGSRRVVTATLAADHRASDGHRGGMLLAAIDRLLQTPEKP
jgi:pyruvate dehydrogenase E2 component (dihydrolipoamide acetyltransferase)